MADASILLAKSGETEIRLSARLANRHGLVVGATGTGKTVTVRVLAEGFSDIGVPVFVADVKGDLSGLAAPGGDNPKVIERAAALALEGYAPRAYPVVFWDIFGAAGHPLRATVSEMGPTLLSRILNLNETQAGLLQLVFRVADEQGLLLLDLKDLRAMLAFAAEHAAELRSTYGNVSPASVGAIQRNLLALEEEGADIFFGEPAAALDDFLQTGADGRGVINILVADKLIHSPRLYATFLLYLLSELFEALPEVGDPDKPVLAFVFDEAHLLFEDTPRALADKIEQVVRLIRSKGVGVYFVTQHPMDLPEPVLAQLGHRVFHALRAFTPAESRRVSTAARTFRPNPALDAEKALPELAVGEALVSVLDAAGRPTPVERALVCPPQSRLAPLDATERRGVIAASVLAGIYDSPVDRDSAHEALSRRAEVAMARAPEPEKPRGRQRQSVFEAFATSTIRAVGSQIGRQIARGLLGSIFGGRR